MKIGETLLNLKAIFLVIFKIWEPGATGKQHVLEKPLTKNTTAKPEVWQSRSERHTRGRKNLHD
jgi:hypothetical protein